MPPGAVGGEEGGERRGREEGDRGGDGFRPHAHRRENVPGRWCGHPSGSRPGPCRAETPSVRGVLRVPGSETGRAAGHPKQGQRLWGEQGRKGKPWGDQRLGFFYEDLGPPRRGLKPRFVGTEGAWGGGGLWAWASGGRKLGRREKWMRETARVLNASGIVGSSMCPRPLRARPGAHRAAPPHVFSVAF